MCESDNVKTVNFVDLQKQHAPIIDDLKAAAARVIESGQYIGGDEVKSFEKEMAEYFGVPEVCSCGCATSGLTTTLKCLGVGPGDEVITTVHTAIPTAEAITLAGGTIVFCDVEPGGYNLDVDKIESLITDKTKVLMPVHLYGEPVDMDKIMALAEKYNLKVLEDCAQAQGASWKGKKLGTIGDASVFSFFPSKNLGGFGDGGAVIAKDPEVMKHIRMYSNHGRTKKYWHEIQGTNSRLDAIQAALLRICLPHLDKWNAGRRKAAAKYQELLADIPEIEIIPREKDGAEHVYHVFVVVVKNRDGLMEYLKTNGIGVGLHYPHSLNVLPAFEFMGKGEGHFPNAEHACANMFSLPMSPVLEEDEVSYVCDMIKAFYSK